jgi:bacillopeptidase F (M6 metalloprotease family)
VTATQEEDWLYLYVNDDEGDFLERLMWEKTIDSKNTWLRYRFDLSDYMGQKIQLLFGTYNDGRGGPSAVYIDDVVLGTCD